MNDNYRIDTDMNETLKNGYVSSGIGLLNSHTLYQDNESSKPNGMNISVENGDANGDYCYMNSSTIYVTKNQNSIDYTKKNMKFTPTYI